MADYFVPSTGPITLSNLVTAFPISTRPVSFGELYDVNANVPTRGQPLPMSAFRNQTAPRPQFTLATATGSNMSMNAAGAISGTTGGSLTVNFLNYLTGQAAQYHKGLTFALTTGTLPTGATLDGSGNLTIGTTVVAGNTNGLQVTVINGWGKTVTIPLSFAIANLVNGATVKWLSRAGGLIVPVGNRPDFGVASHSTNGILIASQFDTTWVAYSATGGGASATHTVNSAQCYASIAHYDVNGNIQWAASIGTPIANALVLSGSVACSSSGLVYVVGMLSVNVATTLTAFNGNTSQGSSFTTSSAGTTGYLACYNSTGLSQWITRLGATGNSTAAYACCVANDGNVFVVGYSNRTLSSVTIGTTTLSYNTASTSSGIQNAYIASFTSTGGFRWAAKIEQIYENERGICITAHGSDGVVITGNYSNDNTVRFFNIDGSTGASFTGPTSSTSAFIVRYDSLGVVKWAARTQNTAAGQGGGVNIQGVCSTADGSVYVCGDGWSYPQMAVTSASSSIVNVPPPSYVSNQIAIMKFDSLGNFQWAFACGGNNTTYTSCIQPAAGNGFYLTCRSVANPFQAFNMNGTPFVSIPRPNEVFWHGIILAYDSNGQGQWSSTIRAEGGSQATTQAYLGGAITMANGMVGLAGYWFSENNQSLRLISNADTTNSAIVAMGNRTVFVGSLQ